MIRCDQCTAGWIPGYGWQCTKINACDVRLKRSGKRQQVPVIDP
jgi:hypothetical protein